VEALASVVTLAADLDAAIQDAVIGDCLGISRQAARQRWSAAAER
jgi:hypothetical protein